MSDFIKRVFRYLFLSEDDRDLIPWQPMLYLATWIAAWILLALGDFGNVPTETADDLGGGIQYLWLGLSLVCPPLALFSLYLTTRTTGYWRYRGFWLGLGADIGQLVALSSYLIIRLISGDYRIYPTAIVIAATVFVFILVVRGVHRLLATEKLASRIVKELQRETE